MTILYVLCNYSLSPANIFQRTYIVNLMHIAVIIVDVT